ncbi:MAG: arginase [Candidatus Saccharimonadia bacterium]
MNLLQAPVALVGVPLDLGAKNLGVDIGPEAFRYREIISKLSNSGIDLRDHGNIVCAARENLNPGDKQQRYLSEIVRVSEETAKFCATEIRSGNRIVALGGDHSITLGLFSGAEIAHPNLGMIYFDAHGDLNTFETSLTGNIHGMHLAALLGHGNRQLVDIGDPGAKLKPKNLLHIGGNDFDPAELLLMQQLDIPSYTLFDLLASGLAPLIQKIDLLAKSVDALWVSLDLDSIDSTYAPGAGMPSMAGLSYREVTAIAEYIGQHCPVIGVDVVEYNPLQDDNHKTAELGIELIAKFLGHNYSWYTNYMAENNVTR